MGKDSASGNRLIANNKKAYFDYFIEDKLEAGLELCGTEVKSIRQGKCCLLYTSSVDLHSDRCSVQKDTK